jgi:hypothetical protein
MTVAGVPTSRINRQVLQSDCAPDSDFAFRIGFEL